MRKHLRGDHGWSADQYDIVGYWRFDSETWDRRYEEVSDEMEAVYEQALADGKGDKVAAEEFDLALETRRALAVERRDALDATRPRHRPTRRRGRRRVVGLLAAAAVLALRVRAEPGDRHRERRPGHGVAGGRSTTPTPATSGSCTICGSRAPFSASSVGIALGLSGALIQGVTRNPLADAQILGINSGAGLFVVAAIAFLGLRSVWSYVWFAFVGAFVAMVLVYLIGMTGRAVATPVRMLLAGVAAGAVMEGISYAHPAAQSAGVRLDAVLGRRRARRSHRSPWSASSPRSSCSGRRCASTSAAG